MSKAIVFVGKSSNVGFNQFGSRGAAPAAAPQGSINSVQHRVDVPMNAKFRGTARVLQAFTFNGRDYKPGQKFKLDGIDPLTARGLVMGDKLRLEDEP